MIKGMIRKVTALSILTSCFINVAYAESYTSCENDCNTYFNYRPSYVNGVGPGLYLGIAAGYAQNGGKDQQAYRLSPPAPFLSTTLVTPDKRQFGSRIYIGYKMNQIASIELGGTFFSTINYNTHGVQTCTGATARIRDVDVLGKLEFGFYQFNLFGKAGVGVIYLTPSGVFQQPYNPPGTNPNMLKTCGANQYYSKAVPVFAVGASYSLTQNWVVDITATQIQTGGIIKSMTLLSGGLSYHFVDVYCGQFLC